MTKFIAIEGVIGVGKTTLARLLKPHFSAQLLFEVFEENPFLADFYANRDQYAFQTQLFFLLSRYQQQKQAVTEALKQSNVIADYTFAKDELFAWLNLKDDELAMYGRVHSALAEKLPTPDLIIYLRASHETLMQRIALRDRPYERDMDPTYIRDLAAAYEAWLANLADVPTLEIDTTKLDFINNEADLAWLIEQIEEVLAQNEGRTRPEGNDLTTYLSSSGALSRYQQFHHLLDQQKGFADDLFYNYILLTEEMGEIAHELAKIWVTVHKQTRQEPQLPAAPLVSQAIGGQRATLRRELADLLAYTLKLANYAGIDLEEAYLEKMRENLHREWDV